MLDRNSPRKCSYFIKHIYIRVCRSTQLLSIETKGATGENSIISICLATFPTTCVLLWAPLITCSAPDINSRVLIYRCSGTSACRIIAHHSITLRSWLLYLKVGLNGGSSALIPLPMIILSFQWIAFGLYRVFCYLEDIKETRGGVKLRKETCLRKVIGKKVLCVMGACGRL